MEFKKYIIEYDEICKSIKNSRYIRQAIPIKAFSGKIIHDVWGRKAALRKNKLKIYNKTIINSSYYDENDTGLKVIYNMRNNSLHQTCENLYARYELYKTLKESTKIK